MGYTSILICETNAHRFQNWFNYFSTRNGVLDIAQNMRQGLGKCIGKISNRVSMPLDNDEVEDEDGIRT